MKSEEEELLRYLDHAPPQVSADDIAMLAAEPRVTYRWAAGLLLAAAIAGTAVAAPGSPVREWLFGSPAPTAGLEAEPPATVPDLALAGIAIVPGQKLVIEFMGLQDSGTARVALIDGDQVQVSAPRNAASFSSEPERVVIENRGMSDFDIALPRSAPYVAVRVAGVTVLRKEGDRVILNRGTTGPASWNIPLTARR
jgi:hypothetical protein